MDIWLTHVLACIYLWIVDIELCPVKVVMLSLTETKENISELQLTCHIDFDCA